jgi:hypothetical protein
MTEDCVTGLICPSRLGEMSQSHHGLPDADHLSPLNLQTLREFRRPDKWPKVCSVSGQAPTFKDR